MAENQSGSGYMSPFGNEKGATSGGPSSGASDFVKDPEGEADKFATSGGRDFTAESKGQSMGGSGCNPDSVADGGILPFGDLDPQDTEMGGVQGVKAKPYKLGGGAGPVEE
jgi:hypothetical protein